MTYEFGGYPLFWLIVIYTFALQWLAFIPAFLFRTEKLYDLTGSLTYMSIVLLVYALIPGTDIRCLSILGCIFVWSLRLGFFLFLRIMKNGSDSRFDNVRNSFWRFLLAWTLQGIWIVFTAGAGLVAATSMQRPALDAFFFVGLALWVLGFIIESVADAQKSAFRKIPANRGRFISSGLWSLSRHPNYFGEIVLWFGVAVIAFPVLAGWQYVTLVSPFFVTLLLTRISGIPLLEEAADRKWGGQADYEWYKNHTPVLVPSLRTNRP